MVTKFLLAIFCEIRNLFLYKNSYVFYVPFYLFICLLIRWKWSYCYFSEYDGDNVANNNLDENGKSQ